MQPELGHNPAVSSGGIANFHKMWCSMFGRTQLIVEHANQPAEGPDDDILLKVCSLYVNKQAAALTIDGQCLYLKHAH